MLLKDKPISYNFHGFNGEYETNWLGRNVARACINSKKKHEYKFKNSSYESCFIEIECIKNNVVVGVESIQAQSRGVK